MAHLRPYCARNAITEAFILPAIGIPRCRDPRLPLRRTFALSAHQQQKLSRKQREKSGIITPEDQERIRKAQEKAAERAAKKAEAPRQGNRAQALLNSLNKSKKIASPAKTEEEQRPPENDEITYPEISLVDRHGRFLKRVQTKEVLWSLNRAEEKLVMIKPTDGKDAGALPICKIFSITELLEKELKEKGRAAQRQRGEKMFKELELSWSIGPADMDMKCKQMIRFLEEGRKVDVTIVRKYRRQAPDRTMDELQGLVDRLKNAVKSVPGAREYRSQDGQLAHTMSFYFEGPRGGIKAEADDAEHLSQPDKASAAVW
ncbi:uncharacterized protein PV09_05275 [Verruconis gallopava]|uniref:Translation initiation factor 3 N-terminal domain-containing protein n=1 Tax=Verruconis gallopava TaxID=253628 RepID=A0A0D2AWK9_9PEZI|nr:uncharacterized protein PV09_05275 [Verruconis gallopava]KIW03509.1 hypothetical protein PV09_05275 [Verruconis gallopava]